MTGPSLPVESVSLQGLPPAPWYIDSTLWWIAVAAVVFLGMTLVATWLWATLRPDQRVYHALALKLRLRPADRSLLRRLVALHGSAAPVALLLSPAPFDHAVSAATASGEPLNTPRLARLRQRLFG